MQAINSTNHSVAVTSTGASSIGRAEHNGIRELTAQEIQWVSGGGGVEASVHAIGLGGAARWGWLVGGPKVAFLLGVAYVVGTAAGYVAVNYGV